jgi:hypothetical protein
MTETQWAIRNLELAGFFDKDSDYEGMIGEAVKRLLLVHSAEGHSGASHYQTLRVFNHVATGKALTAQWWDERKAEYDKMSASHGARPWTDEEFAKISGPRPPSNEETGSK